jgi:hypothetical protein
MLAGRTPDERHWSVSAVKAICWATAAATLTEPLRRRSDHLSPSGLGTTYWNHRATDFRLYVE